MIYNLSRFLFLNILYVCTFTSFTNAQIKQVTNKSDLEKIYVQSIYDFIQAAEKKTGKVFDTLFINKRKQNDEDDFPEITLPKTIGKTTLVLDNFDTKLELYRKLKYRMNLNLIGWVDTSKAEFMFVMFSNGFDHQYDYNINYNYNKKTKKYEMVSIKHIDQPSNPNK